MPPFHFVTANMPQAEGGDFRVQPAANPRPGREDTPSQAGIVAQQILECLSESLQTRLYRSLAPVTSYLLTTRLNTRSDFKLSRYA
jgi:hypothetical protein